MKSDKKKEKIIIYSKYKLSVKEYIQYGSIGTIILFFMGYIFYESFIVSFCALPLLYFYFKYIKVQLGKKRREQLIIEFREMCMSFAAQLSAGYSLENSVKETQKEMSKMFGKQSDMARELQFMIEKLKINIPIEFAMQDLAERSRLEDIRLFSDILGIAREGGGDLVAIVKSTAMGISEKLDTDREIRLMMGEKMYEQKIMNMIPLVMILYVKMSSPELISIMYETDIGKLIMTGCLVVYCIAVYLGKRITNISI